MALRSTGVSTSPSRTRCSRSATKARISPSSRREHERDPEEAVRGEVGRGPAGREKLKTTSVETTKRSIAGNRVARAKLEQEVLARRARRRQTRYVMPARAGCRGKRRDALGRREWRRRASARRRERRAPRRAAPIPALVEAGIRLVEEQEVGVVQERAAEREPLLHAPRVRRRRARAAPPRARSARGASRSARAAPARGTGGRRGRGSRARTARGRREARGRGTRCGSRAAETSSSPRVGASRPAQSASSVDLPEPFGPVTTRKLALGDIEVEAAKDALLAEVAAEAARA